MGKHESEAWIQAALLCETVATLMVLHGAEEPAHGLRLLALWFQLAALV